MLCQAPIGTQFFKPSIRLLRFLLGMAFGALLHVQAVAQKNVSDTSQINQDETDFFDDAILTESYGSANVVQYKRLFKIQQFKCKGTQLAYKILPLSAYIDVRKIASPKLAQKAKILEVHGNITYDFFYRSRIDTPFQQDNLQQHTERVALSILYKEKYPFSIGFTARQSNSRLFQNFGDLNIRFDQNSYLNQLKQVMLKKLDVNTAAIKRQMDSLEALLLTNTKMLQQKAHGLNSAATLQQLIEKREKEYFSNNVAIPEAENIEDTGIASLENNINKYKQKGVKWFANQKNQQTTALETNEELSKISELSDSLQNVVAKQKKKYDSLVTRLNTDYIAVKQKIEQAKSLKALLDVSNKTVIKDSASSKIAKFLSSVKQFNIGRSTVNYTDLTANNIIITGINAEMSNKNYLAVCAGKIDYRFRDFFDGRSATNNQYMAMVRYGFGLPDKRAVIFSVFQGRKSTSQFGITDSINQHVNILGYAVEAIARKNENTFASVEIAKSTMPVTGNLVENKAVNSLVDFAETKNLAIAIKAETKLVR